MQILKETGIDWRERRLISNLYMAQSAKVRLNRGETRSVKIGRGVRQGCCRKLLDDLKERRGYSHLKEEALDRTMWRARFGRGFGPVIRQTTK
jgi:hypothetical protein